MENHYKVSFAFDDESQTLELSQKVIVQRSGLNPTSQRRRRSRLEFEMKRDDETVFEDLQIPTLFRFSIEGDSAGEGLVTFGARFFTTWALSEDIMKGFEGVGDRLKNNE